jgi:hypothetical protein
VDIEDGALKQVEQLQVPCTRAVVEIRGDEAKVKAALAGLPKSGTAPALVSVVLESPKLVLGQHESMRSYLEKQFPDEATRPALAAWKEVRALAARCPLPNRRLPACPPNDQRERLRAEQTLPQ